MNRDELGKLYPITIVEYNPEWSKFYELEKNKLMKYFNQNLRIEHIGSTTVNGLSAKPTIDILFERPGKLENSQIIKVFEENGYIYMKEQKRHLMFVKGYTSDGLEDISYHIHMGLIEQDWLWDRIYFRDYLNNNDKEKQKYQNLKYSIAKKYKNDREAYTEAKTDYINKVTGLAKAQTINII